MKKVFLILFLIIFITSCVPEPEELAGVTREELLSGRSVDKVITYTQPEMKLTDTSKQTLEQAHEKEKVIVAETAWESMRGNPKAIEGGAIEAAVGDNFRVRVE